MLLVKIFRLLLLLLLLLEEELLLHLLLEKLLLLLLHRHLMGERIPLLHLVRLLDIDLTHGMLDEVRR